VPHADFISFNMVKNMRGPNGGVLIYGTAHHEQIAEGLFPRTQGGANENTMFAKLVALEELGCIDIASYARRMVDVARLLAETLRSRGIEIVTGGTDSHLVLIDLRSSGLSGADAERACERHRVLVNRNLVPHDHRAPKITSGVRLGSACIAILGYCDADVRRLGRWLADRFTGAADNEPDALVGELAERYNHALLPPA
jgi:glycine hydroxymethyltransferase